MVGWQQHQCRHKLINSHLATASSPSRGKCWQCSRQRMTMNQHLARPTSNHEGRNLREGGRLKLINYIEEKLLVHVNKSYKPTVNTSSRQTIILNAVVRNKFWADGCNVRWSCFSVLLATLNSHFFLELETSFIDMWTETVMVPALPRAYLCSDCGWRRETCW